MWQWGVEVGSVQYGEQCCSCFPLLLQKTLHPWLRLSAVASDCRKEPLSCCLSSWGVTVCECHQEKERIDGNHTGTLKAAEPLQHSVCCTAIGRMEMRIGCSSPRPERRRFRDSQKSSSTSASNWQEALCFAFENGDFCCCCHCCALDFSVSFTFSLCSIAVS